MTDVTEIAGVLRTLGPDELAAMRDVLSLAVKLDPDKRTPFLNECLAAVEGELPRPADQLVPVLDRWAGEVAS